MSHVTRHTYNLKNKILFFVVFFTTYSLFLTPYSSAQPISSSDLINKAKDYDEQTVVYTGEVIGDIMVRKDYTWIHINDGTIAIGIWVPKTLVQDIHYIGNYHNKGDIIEVTGVFHRSCLEHGGDLDIHASKITIVNPGALTIQPISRKKINTGAYSLLLILMFFCLKYLLPTKSASVPRQLI